MPASYATVDDYLAALPDDRRAVVSALRDVVRANLPEGYAEAVQYGMIGYAVPHSRYPWGYHCDPKQPVPFASIAAQKSHYAVYLMCVYGSPELTAWFTEEYAKTGKKLDMGKGCVRFKKADDIPFELIGRTIARVPVDTFLAAYEAALPEAVKAKRAKGR